MDKVMRMHSVTSTIENGNVAERVALFPSADRDDLRLA
jgi:hypothetical protein